MSKRHNYSAPEKLERRMLELFPRFPELVETLMSADELRWPDWCYLPMSGAYAIITGGVDGAENAQNELSEYGAARLPQLAGTIAWRASRIILRYDTTLAEELMAQELGDVPSEILKRLPWPGVFIEDVPGVKNCDGLLAWLEYDARYKDSTELRLLYLMKDGMAASCPLMLYGKTVEAAVKDTTIKGLLSMGEMSPEVYGKMIIEHLEKSGEFVPQMRGDLLRGHINMLLYLCSQEPDIEAAPWDKLPAERRPAGAKPAPPARGVVGRRMGSLLRLSRAKLGEAPAQNTQGGTHASPIPHMRRAHWHSFWTGEGRKKLIVKWVAPMLINADLEGMDGAVIRRVK